MDQMLNITGKTTKILEENMDMNLHYFGVGSGFLDMIPKAQGTKR